ncbi:MAG: response regulator [Alphaproteobacteria bacterium]|nr:response regulator [Alphaproteobacteria bacterium]
MAGDHEDEEWPHVLVVDDVEDNRDLLRRRLMIAHFQVTEAKDGHECLDALARERFDAVLLDFMMPGLDGLETLRRIRSTWSKADMPVIMVTARDEDPMIVRCLEAGANDFVAKPFSFAVLHARLRAHLPTPKAA